MESTATQFRVSGFGFRVTSHLAPRTSPRGVGGQTTAEYAILIGVVIAALVGMQVYVKRGLNARLKDASDTVSHTVLGTLGNVTNPTADEHFQYEPTYASSDYNVRQATSRTETVGKDTLSGRGGVFTKANVLETTNRNGSQTTSAP